MYAYNTRFRKKTFKIFLLLKSLTVLEVPTLSVNPSFLQQLNTLTKFFENL